MRVLFALLALAASVATVSAQGWTGPNFYIVGNTGIESYNFSINGVIVNNPSFNLTVGTTYKFILNASLSNHPFGFSADGLTMSNATDASVGGMTLSGSCGAGTNANTLSWITTTGNEANPCIVSFTPPAAAVGQPPIVYRCSQHPLMKGNLTAVAAGAAATTAPPTTPAPSGTGNGTTAPPTSTPSPAGSSSSTGKSGAAVLVPGAAVFLIAAINALFA